VTADCSISVLREVGCEPDRACLGRFEPGEPAFDRFILQRAVSYHCAAPFSVDAVLPSLGELSRSFSFDQRRRPDTLCTASAIAFR
jgi:hypothetical protein